MRKLKRHSLMCLLNASHMLSQAIEQTPASLLQSDVNADLLEKVNGLKRS